MTDSTTGPPTAGPPPEAPPGGLLDDADQAVLDHLDRVAGVLDPPPYDLDARVGFAIQLDDLDSAVDREVARLGETELVSSAHRGTEVTRTLSFEADSRAILVTVLERPDGQVRLDGWLAPAGPARVELRLAGDEPPRVVTADGSGGFVFDGVPRGLAQLRVDPPDGAGPSVVTPSFAL